MGIFGFFRRGGQKAREQRPGYKDMEVLQTKKGSYEKFREKMLRSSMIMLIIGKRGSGKTSLGFKLLEFFHYNGKGRPCYAVGYSKSQLPKWIRKVEAVEHAPDNSVVLLDEGAIGYFSRDSMKQANKVLSKMMTVARHKNLTLIIITQNCMPAATKILTENGVKELKDINDGIKVFSYNLNKNKIELKKARISDEGKAKVITIETADGDIIECSPNHRFLVREGDKIVEKPARELREDDDLLKPIKPK